MTPDRPLHRDNREDIEGLVHRGRIILPEVILPDGTASPFQFAIVPFGVDLAKAFLYYRELPGPPARGQGLAIVGTREPDMGSYLEDVATALGRDSGHPHITRPQCRGYILKWLYDITGIRFAPAALWRVAGWEIGWLANWLDRLLTGGAMATLIVAERQAAASVRAAWIASRDKTATPLMDTGILLVGRALIDVLRAFERVVDEASKEADTVAARESIQEAYAAISQRLRSCLRAIEDAAADQMLTCDRRKKITKALKHARAITESIGLFTVVSEPVGQRVCRVTKALPTNGRNPPSLPTTFTQELTDAGDRLEAIIAGAPTPPTLPVTWCREMIGDLSRLQDPSSVNRHHRLTAVRTDLAYKLIVTRRLDRLFEALPWMAAPSAAFPLTFGGPLGAMAAMFEVARYREIAIELMTRLYESGSGKRLDTLQGKQVYADPLSVRATLRYNARAGFWLASSALSHHMVRAFLSGRTFNAAHPLPALHAGRLTWRFEQAMRHSATMTTVTETELGKPIYATTDYHRDLPRYMGLTIADMLTAGLVDIFPGELRGPGFHKFMEAVDASREDLKLGRNPFAADRGPHADRQLLRSILRSLEEPSDGVDADWRDDPFIRFSHDTRELNRFNDRNIGHTGKRPDAGGRVRQRAAAIRKAQKDSGKVLRRMVSSARSWTETSDDWPLAGVLSGRLRLSATVPVAQTGIPAIWFRPTIDTAIHDWIAQGAPMWSPIVLGSVVHTGLIAKEVERVTTAMPLLFGLPVSLALRRRILTPLWTGVAGITEDHAHYRRIKLK